MNIDELIEKAEWAVDWHTRELEAAKIKLNALKMAKEAEEGDSSDE